MNSLIIQDPLYGTQEIVSPVVLEIIASAPFQRLKGISQYGIPDEFYHLKNFYRFEHCIGTYLLLKKSGATEAEQVAGLLMFLTQLFRTRLIGYCKTPDTQKISRMNSTKPI